MDSGIRNLDQQQESATTLKEPKKKNRKKPASTANSEAAKPAPEDVNNFLENIKLDWQLFWAGIAGEDELKDQDPFETGKLEVLNLEQVKQITRALSLDRKKIHQRMEQIHRELDLNTERIESIKLVGGDLTETIEEINKLNDVGMKLSLQLEKVSERLAQFRSLEDELKGLR